MTTGQRWICAIIFVVGLACGLMLALNSPTSAQDAAQADVHARYDASLGIWFGGVGMTVVDRSTDTAYFYVAETGEKPDGAGDAAGPPFNLVATFDLTSTGDPQLDVDWQQPPED
ncbi:MAG: hypothetical protein WD534_07505 [Phycisphaeraceae bacterium]